LETALRGVIIGNRWPKSGVEVIITILEGEEDQWWGNERTGTEPGNSGQWGFMSALSGCITVASAAIVDAGIDCVDVISGGIAALVATPKVSSDSKLCTLATSVVLDPVPSEHTNILAACVVGYLPSRDEITDLLLKGKLGGMNRHSESANSTYDDLVDGAVQAALGSHCVLTAALKEAAEMRNIS
jgi:exosome complex component MTR3